MTVEEAERLAATSFGLKVRARPLGSQQDSNFVLVEPDDRVLGVLKIANPVFTAAEIEAQDAAAEHVAAAGGLRAGTVRAGPVTVPTGDGPALARVLTYLPGGTLTGPGYLSPRVVAEIGAVAGQVSRALRSFTHPGLDRVLQWDLRHADRVVGRLAEHVPDASLRGRVADAAGQAWRRVQPLAGDLPRQAIHGDLTGDNLVCTTRDGLRTPDGVIDFGDSTISWAVGELAVAITSVLRHAGAEPCSTLPAVRSFHRIRPLSEEEAAALWPLVVLRAAVLVVSGEQQAAIDDGNEYVTGALEDERRTFSQALSVPAEVMTALIMDDLGFGRAPLRVPRGAVLDLDPARCGVLDLSVRSDAADAGAWLEPDLADRLAGAGLAAGSAAVITRYGEPRLTASAVLAGVSPASVATGIDVWLADAAELTAPWAGRGDRADARTRRAHRRGPGADDARSWGRTSRGQRRIQRQRIQGRGAAPAACADQAAPEPARRGRTAGAAAGPARVRARLARGHRGPGAAAGPASCCCTRPAGGGPAGPARGVVRRRAGALLP